MPKKEIYFSLDIESNGPIPGVNAMLSFALAAYDLENKDPKEHIGSLSFNLKIPEETVPDPNTMRDFWSRNEAAYEATRVGVLSPEAAMPAACDWVADVSAGNKPVCVAYPAAFDFMWWHWYAIRYTGKDPFSFQALDIKTLAMALLNVPYKSVGKRSMPERWKPKTPHTHVALDDAIEQGQLFVNMMKDLSDK